LGIPLPPPDAPGPFNLANADKLAQSLTDAGFHDARTESLTMSVTFSSAEVFARFQRATNQMVVGLIAQQPPERQAALWETVAQAGARMASPDGSITLHNRCICVSGQA
jgi:hypothetical protein